MSQIYFEDEIVSKKMKNDITLTPIPELTDKCLHQLFFHVAVPDRIRMERVCKQWERASKKSWIAVEKLVITSPRDPNRSIIEGAKEFVSLRTLNKTIINSILSRCGKYIKYFALEEFDEPFNTDIISIICKYCRNIENIDIMEVENPYEKGLGELFYVNHNIKCASFVVCFNGIDECLRYLSPKNLEQLVLAIPQQPIGLYYLNELLKNAHTLKYLKLREYVIDSYTIELIGNIQSLRELRLICLEPDELSIQKAFIRISNLKNLQVLSITGKCVTDELLKRVINNSRNLQSLSLSGCQNVTENGLGAISTLSQLKSLIIGNISRLNDKVFVNLRTLEFIKCSGCKSLTERGVITLIRNSPNLKTIYILDCGIINEKEMLNAAAAAVEMRKNTTALKIIIHGSKNNKNYEEFLPYVQVVMSDNDDDDDDDDDDNDYDEI